MSRVRLLDHQHCPSSIPHQAFIQLSANQKRIVLKYIMADIPVFVTSDQTSSERRISPSWSISELKSRLETITGIPPSSQRLQIYISSTDTTAAPVEVNPKTEDSTFVGQFNLTAYGRIHVDDTRPPAARGNYNDVSKVEKYVMPETEYEKRNDSVLAWKKQNHLGRFNENAATGGTGSGSTQQSLESAKAEIESLKITVGARCRILNPSTTSTVIGDGQERRGVVKFIGEVPEIKGHQLFWVGVELDEPLGKNDGTIQGVSYFDAKPKHGSFVKPSNVEIGDFPELDPFADDDEEEL